jgi:DnaK suppressor protein
MESETIHRFRIILESERQRLLDNSKEHLKNIPQHMTQTSGDEGDEAQTLLETDMTLRFKDRERQLLDKITRALERIKDGTFGVCEACEEEIGIRRLETRPIATLCITCKEAEERLEKTFAQD